MQPETANVHGYTQTVYSIPPWVYALAVIVVLAVITGIVYVVFRLLRRDST